jgi:hypothetical protein
MIKKSEIDVAASAPLGSIAQSGLNKSDLSYEEIASFAFSDWVACGCKGRLSEADWNRAEREIHTRKNSVPHF